MHPIFGDLAFTNEVSPFLMFDYGGPQKFEPTSKRRGVGEHPHRGTLVNRFFSALCENFN